MINNNDYNFKYSGFSVNTDIPEIANEKPKSEKFSKLKELFEWFDVVSYALIIVIVIFGFLFRVTTISGDSMLNTLHDKEMVIISNLSYTPKAGDIVVVSRNIENTASSNQKNQGPIIKRVIATEGQTVDIDFKKSIVYVDGVALKENYTSTPTTSQYDVLFPVTVPEGHIFVLGDNRAVSLDSRSSSIGTNGMIDERYVLGHAVYRIFPFSVAGSLKNK
jgi:signal peptidase I